MDSRKSKALKVLTEQNERLAYHVLRSSGAGITVYVQAHFGEKGGRDPWPYREPYVIAYEAETESGRQQRQIIAETESAASLQAVITLMEAHICRIKHQLLPHVLEHRAIDSRRIAACSGFKTDAVRTEVIGRLRSLCKGPLRSRAYTGFMNGVYSSIDDWLAAGAGAAEQESLACDWVQGLTASTF